MRDEFITLVHTWRDDRCNFPKYNPSICPSQKCDIEAVSIIKGKDLFSRKVGVWKTFRSEWGNDFRIA